MELASRHIILWLYPWNNSFIPQLFFQGVVLDSRHIIFYISRNIVAVSLMEFTALRMTVDIEGSPCRQLYKQNGALFWDLDYLHPALVHHGAEKHKFHWLLQVDKACSDVLFPFLVGTTRVHTARRDTPSDRLAANTCTAPAPVVYLWHTILGARLKPIADCCRDYLVRITARACEVIPVDGVSLPLPREQCLHIARNGQVSLFFESLVAFHCNVAKAWLNMWAVMRLLGLLDADAEAYGRNSLRDVVVFVAMFRKTKKKTVSAFTSKLLDEFSFAIFFALVGDAHGQVCDGQVHAQQ